MFHVSKLSRLNKLAFVVCVVLVIGFVCVACKFYNLDAPSVSIFKPVDVTWSHLLAERWGYTLRHDTRVAYLGFWPHGGVGATIGTRDGALANGHWDRISIEDQNATSFGDHGRNGCQRILCLRAERLNLQLGIRD
jgi:hypothetical protein